MLRATKLKEKLSGFSRSIYSKALYLLLAKVYQYRTFNHAKAWFFFK
jgi:hypothetical protein